MRALLDGERALHVGMDLADEGVHAGREGGNGLPGRGGMTGKRRANQKSPGTAATRIGEYTKNDLPGLHKSTATPCVNGVENPPVS